MRLKVVGMKNNLKFAVALVLAGSSVPAFAQQVSLGEAARRAQEQKKEAPRAKRVYGNEDLATAGTISVVGSAPASGSTTPSGSAAGTTGSAATDTTTSTATGTATGATAKPGDKAKDSAAAEAAWRKKYSELRDKIALKAKEIDVTQRELNLKQQQYYSDPNVALREQYSRSDINDSKTKIDDMRRELVEMQAQLTDLDDQLRRAGLPSSWSRE